MRFSRLLSPNPDRERGAAVVTTAFAALTIGVGTIIFTSASAAEPPADPSGVDIELGVQQPAPAP